MKIVVAPDSFKESLTASEAADAVEEGFRQVFPEAEIVKPPMSDGGEGLVHSLVSALDGEIVKKKVTGPLGGKVESFYGLIHEGKTAVIEMAAAAGLHLVPAEKKKSSQNDHIWGGGTHSCCYQKRGGADHSRFGRQRHQ